MKKLGIVGLIAGAVLLSGCSKYAEQFNDVPTTGSGNDAAVEIIGNADGFSNVSTKCDHGNRLYVAYHGDSPYAAIAVSPQDPTCAK